MKAMGSFHIDRRHGVATGRPSAGQGFHITVHSSDVTCSRRALLKRASSECVPVPARGVDFYTQPVEHLFPEHLSLPAPIPRLARLGNYLVSHHAEVCETPTWDFPMRRVINKSGIRNRHLTYVVGSRGLEIYWRNASPISDGSRLPTKSDDPLRAFPVAS